MRIIWPWEDIILCNMTLKLAYDVTCWHLTLELFPFQFHVFRTQDLSVLN